MASLALSETLKKEVMAIDQKMRKNILGIEKVTQVDFRPTSAARRDLISTLRCTT